MLSTPFSTVPRCLVHDPTLNLSAELSSVDGLNIGIIESVVPSVCSSHRTVDGSNASRFGSITGSGYP